MAAPTPAGAAGTPEGIKLDDGFSTKIHIDILDTLSIWEKVVTPPGMEGGDPVETSTMRNTKWRTFRPRHLLSLTPMTLVGAYDPNVFDDLIAILNVDATITVFYPDTSTLAFYGFAQTAESGDNTEGEQPEMTLTLVPTNWDPINNVEAGPVMTEAAGT